MCIPISQSVLCCSVLCVIISPTRASSMVFFGMMALVYVQPDPIGVNWFGAQARGISMVGIQDMDPNQPISAVLLCAVCDNITNPCFFNGIFRDDGTCICTTGSSGTLCQVTPDRNELCNTVFNTSEFDYDGGDCCEATCVSTEDNSCGHTKI